MMCVREEKNEKDQKIAKNLGIHWPEKATSLLCGVDKAE